MRLSLVTLVVASIVGASGDAAALDPARRVSQYVHRHLDARDGMPHSLANSLAQTRDGYLWAGTEQGLARFDGQHFTSFERADGLTTNSLTALAADRDGGLWIGTRERGLSHLSGGTFRTVADDGSIGLQVRALALDRDGDLWVGTRDRGVAHLRAGAVVSALRVADGLPSDDVRGITITRDGAIWIATYAGAVQLVGGRIVAGPPELIDVHVHAIAEDRRGDLWFGTANGLARLHAGALAYVDLGTLPATAVLRLLGDRDGNLWLGLPSGIARRTEDGRFEAFATSDARTLALLEDREGNVWFGSEHGLDRLSDGDVVSVGAAEGFTDHSVFGVFEDSAGTMWFATEVGLFRWPRGDGAPTNVAPDRGTVYSIHEDAHGDVWSGSRDGGVGRWHDGRFTWLWTSTWEKVRAIAGADGALWLGTDHGLFRQRGERLDQIESVLPGLIINAIAVDAGGSLWLGTEGGGLRRLMTSGTAAPVPPGGPPAWSSVTTLSFEPDGTLWAGTEGDGLWILSDGRWTAVTAKDGMFDDLVWRVLDDGHGALWMSSNRGIWKVRRDQLVARAAGGTAPVVSTVYGEADGMRERECNGAVWPAGWRTRDGRLWFPTGKGVAIVDPAKLHAPEAPAALVESARVDGQERALAGPLVLAPGASRFEIRFTAPAMRAPERVRYRYRLDGIDGDWNEAGTQELAQYTNLSPGHYRFMVQASLGGAWGDAGRLDVTLEPRFYQTLWFYVLAILAAVLAILAIPVLRVRQLHARERELAARVQEALGEVKVLSGMLPICAWCKKVRDDRGYWNKIEAYLSARTDAKFSHGICPDCYAKVDAEENSASR